jgi:hypothetical protein
VRLLTYPLPAASCGLGMGTVMVRPVTMEFRREQAGPEGRIKDAEDLRRPWLACFVEHGRPSLFYILSAASRR